MFQLSVRMQSVCLPSTAARQSTTDTLSCSSFTTSSSSFGVPTLWQPWARSLCLGPLPRITGPSRSLMISLPTPSSPLWDGPSGWKLDFLYWFFNYSLFQTKQWCFWCCKFQQRSEQFNAAWGGLHLAGYLQIFQEFEERMLFSINGAFSEIRRWLILPMWHRKECVILYFLLMYRYHTGSLAFGSLILSLVQVIRVILEYLDHKLKGQTDYVHLCMLSHGFNV